MGTPANPQPAYRGHAAALAAVLAVSGQATRRRHPSNAGLASGPWTAVGFVIGAALVAGACLLALAGTGSNVTAGGLLSAVPSDAAFGATVRQAAADMRPYESASTAADLPEPEAWAAEFVARAVDPALGRLAMATPPVHLRAPTESAVSALHRVEAELDGYTVCRSRGGRCSTQRQALDHAVDEAYRLLGDLSLYTFG